MRTVTIADNLFLPYGKSMRCSGPNANIGPSDFEWEMADPQSARFVTDSYLKEARGPGQVAILLETFFLHPENYVTALQKNFDCVLCCNSYFTDHREKWLWMPHGGSRVPFDQWGMHDKTKNISILASPKQSLFGHRMMNKVAEMFGRDVDIYGLDHYVEKNVAIAPYRYTVVVEAEIQRDFFSEKLIDCLSYGTIPIYWGCPNISGYFLPEGILEHSCFIGLAQTIHDIILGIWKDTGVGVLSNIQLAREYAICEDWLWMHYPFLFGRS